MPHATNPRRSPARCRTPLLSQPQQQLVLAAPQDQYLTSRQQALHQVESTIVELGTIFQQLAHMVRKGCGCTRSALPCPALHICTAALYTNGGSTSLLG